MSTQDLNVAQKITIPALFALNPSLRIRYIEKGLNHGYAVVGAHLQELEVAARQALILPDGLLYISSRKMYKPRMFKNIHQIISEAQTRLR